MFPLFETIKIVNGVPKNLYWHQRRLEYSYQKVYARLPEIVIAEVLTVPVQYRSGIVKLRFLYNRDSFSCEYHHYTRKKIKSIKLIEDDNIDYSLKYTDRRHLNELLQKKDECDDILIVKRGMVTDCSFANIVFFNGKHWITPSNPLLKGTCRERLLHEEKIISKQIPADDLRHYSRFKLINAMLDFEDQKALDISAIKC